MKTKLILTLGLLLCSCDVQQLGVTDNTAKTKTKLGDVDISTVFCSDSDMNWGIDINIYTIRDFRAGTIQTTCEITDHKNILARADSDTTKCDIDYGNGIFHMDSSTNIWSFQGAGIYSFDQSGNVYNGILFDYVESNSYCNGVLCND